MRNFTRHKVNNKERKKVNSPNNIYMILDRDEEEEEEEEEEDQLLGASLSQEYDAWEKDKIRRSLKQSRAVNTRSTTVKYKKNLDDDWHQL